MYSQHDEYVDVLAAQHTQMHTQMEVLEKNVAMQVRLIDRALQGVAKDQLAWVRRAESIEQGNHHLRRIVETLVGVRSILVINADGRTVMSNRPALIGQDFSQGPIFIGARDNPDPALLRVSPPFTTVLGTYAIGLARALTGPDGQFAGVIIAITDPEYFSILLDSVRHTADTRSSIVHGDGKLFMIVPPQPDLSGKNLAEPGTLFTRHRESGRPSNIFSDVTYLTGERRMVALQTIRSADLNMDKALVATVSRPEAAIFAAWRRDSWVLGLVYAGFAMMACLGLLTYQRRREVAVRDLQSSEAHLQSIFAASPDALLVCDVHGTIVMGNHQVECLFGYPVAELLNQPIEILVPDMVREKHAAHRHDFHSAPTTRRMGQGLEAKVRRKDGSECAVEIRLSQIRTEKGLFVTTSVRDITERKQAEAKIHRLNQLYAALSHCNQAIVRCTSEDELFSTICHDVVSVGGMKMAWIGKLDASSQYIHPVASHGDGIEYLTDIRISAAVDDPLGRGPTGTALRENRAFWCQDFLNDPNTTAWHDHAARYGFAAAASLPLHCDGKIVGTFTLYADEISAFGEDTQKLLTEMATDISFALDNFAREVSRTQAVQAQHEGEELLAFSLQTSNTGGWVLNLADQTALRTLEHDRIFGYTSLQPEWTYSMFLDHVLEEDRAEVDRLFQEAVANGTDWSFECRIRRTDGEVRWIWAAGKHRHDAAGQVRQLAGIV